MTPFEALALWIVLTAIFEALLFVFAGWMLKRSGR